MCFHRSPLPPLPPPSPSVAIAQRETKAKSARETERRRLAKKKGGAAYLSQGFGGIFDTLIGTRVPTL